MQRQQAPLQPVRLVQIQLARRQLALLVLVKPALQAQKSQVLQQTTLLALLRLATLVLRLAPAVPLLRLRQQRQALAQNLALALRMKPLALVASRLVQQQLAQLQTMPEQLAQLRLVQRQMSEQQLGQQLPLRQQPAPRPMTLKRLAQQ